LLQARITASADLERAKALIREMAGTEKEEDSMAEILFTGFQIEPSEANRKAAIEIYERLNRENPSFRYQEKLSRLGAC
jgi:hypothetical protein